jgi:hypothetical protein
MSKPSAVLSADNGEAAEAAAQLKYEEKQRRKGKNFLLDDIAIISGRLRHSLRELSVVSLDLVYVKQLSLSDRLNSQNRLFMSSKAKDPFEGIFSEAELVFVHQLEQQQKDEESEENTKDEEKKQKQQTEEEEDSAVEEKPAGLDVQAYDRNGEMYVPSQVQVFD